jgi:hypothetical protein
MPQKIRKQVYIEPKQEILLKRLARARGVTEAEVIRNAIEREASSISLKENTFDLKAWDDLRVFILSLIDKGPVSGGRKWNREDIYEERVNRNGR